MREEPSKISLPSQQKIVKGSKSEPFRFMSGKGEKKGKDLNYREAVLHDVGKKWYVYYSFYHEGKWHPKKVYEDINRIKNISDKRAYGMDLVWAVNDALKKGFNPFSLVKLKIEKVWTVNQAVSYFKTKLEERGLRKRTLQSYSSGIRMLEKYFNTNDPLHSLTKSECNTRLLKAHRDNKWSNTTFNNNLTFCRTVWSFLIDNEITKDNPFTLVKPLEQTISRNQAMTDTEWKKVKENADPELLGFLTFLYHTGTRPSEANQLTYSHILQERGLLFIPGKISKNKKDGYVSVSKEYLNTLKGEGVIFGKPINYFSKKFLALRSELKLNKNVTLYSIKHTRAVHLAEAGASPYSIMQLFRHSSLTITMSYLKSLGLNISTEAAEMGIKL